MSTGSLRTAIIEVRDLVVEYATRQGKVRAVDRVSFRLGEGQRLGIVGESGSGKTTLGLAIAGLLPKGGRSVSGVVNYGGRDITVASERELRHLRGQEMAMVFQDAKTALDPVRTIGSQIVEAITAHRQASKAEALETALSLLREVELPEPEQRLRQYPHELSGGMRQRAMIAMALAGQPRLLIADEPTSALDVTTQAGIMALLKDLGDKRSMSTVLITHDLSVVAGFADLVLVMYAGAAMELGQVDRVFETRAHPYSRALIQAVPSMQGPRRRRLDFIPGSLPSTLELPRGCRFAPRCPIADSNCRENEPALTWNSFGTLTSCHYPGVSTEASGKPLRERISTLPTVVPNVANGVGPGRPVAREGGGNAMLRVQSLFKTFHIRRRQASFRVRVQAVVDVSFEVRPGESFGIVGESGSGKTTLARMLVGLTEPDSGVIDFEVTGVGRDKGARHSDRVGRGRVQMIFQDPTDSLDPLLDVEHLVAEPLEITKGGRADRYRAQVLDALAAVGLGGELLHRKPSELSGGQRQRVAIARALTTSPALLIADEAVASLDMSARGQVLNLLRDLVENVGIAVIHISHDLSMVRHVCDRVAVMHAGRVVELADTEVLFGEPRHPYTACLISSVPVPDPAFEHTRVRAPVRAGVLVPSEAGIGCPYRSRCRRAQEVCAKEAPPLVELERGHLLACHFPEPKGALVHYLGFSGMPGVTEADHTAAVGPNG